MTALLRPRPITKHDDTSAFDCGKPSLTSWLQIRAIRNEAGGASRTFISVDQETDRVAGYYCLSASSLRSEDAPGALRRNMPDPIPVVLIGRLAVDSEFQGMGLGASLLQDALLKSIEASRLVGARAVIVYALDDDAVAFYERYGFSRVPETARCMYLLIADAESTIASAAR
ncbi:GNAT family N-acetyltransferase [Curtobacterium sp. MCPF17_002]|jgi:predicted N-acetyltransferase YhbS|uniref:GNAT family N-acetyltransferase n=1 Tax=Curtobacterium sp. MCPF17_002 TaxID=2175645 RepID=UPI000DA7844F|nr:GNAT family N-acetyltransferase [Curtobacterium sp. MCPF17_002]WIB78370.1 GNAT family N-acetyltransferase [Curtobacterium sp. MCPF17_002]